MFCFPDGELEASPARFGSANGRNSMLEPRHKVFLSHSGYQKPFVKKLCADLVVDRYIPFFDQRHDSLPKGEKFAELIIDAARKCKVGVVVLSEEYLTSKWPMLELVEFWKAREEEKRPEERLKVLPLYYKLTIEEVKNETNRSRWKRKWQSFAERDKRIVLKDWDNAFRLLYEMNGIPYVGDDTDVSYGRRVIEHIWNICPPYSPYDLDQKEGWMRICEVLSVMFVADEGVEKLGIYGAGGMGKTTICKAMCNFFHQRFYGRVFHLELVSGRQDLSLCKLMLKTLFRLGDDVLETVVSQAQVVPCLKEHARFLPVLLIIDNVQDDTDSQEEARRYLGARFCAGSRIVITSRSQWALDDLLPGPEFITAMPRLERDEAAKIFLRRALRRGRELESLDREETKVLDACLEECSFTMQSNSSLGWRRRNGQYHPLALTALASYFERKVRGSSKLMEWEPYLGDFDKLKLSKESDRMFGILGMQLRTFTKTKKLLFFDVAIFSRGEVELYLKSVDEWCDWLAMVHPGMRKAEVRSELEELKDVGIVDWGNSAITTHELYKEYAEWCLSPLGEEAENLHTEVWCVRHKPSYGESLPRALERKARGGWWPELDRLWLEGVKRPLAITPMKVQEWRNVVVLRLHECSHVKELDLHSFCCLRHLELVDMEELETVQFHATKTAGYNRDGQSSGGQGVESSEWVDPGEEPTFLEIVMMKDLGKLREVLSFRSLGNLQKLVMIGCPNLVECFSFQMCPMLSTLWLDKAGGFVGNHIDLSPLSVLRDLSIREFDYLKLGRDFRIEGLGRTQLESKLTLFRIPVRSLPGLDKLTRLRVISLEWCQYLQELEGLSCLSSLEILNVPYTAVRELPGVDKLLQLRSIDCTWCQELVWLPDLEKLPKLTFLSTRGCKKLVKYPRVPRDHFVHSSDGTCARCNKLDCSCNPYDQLDDEGDDITNLMSGGLL